MSAISGFLEKETAGLPNWGWIAIIAAGIGVTYLGPKLFGNLTGTHGNSPTTSTDAGSTSGIGLAIDPTTGLPYAVEGLVPTGGLSGTGPPVGTPSGGNLMQEIGIIRSRGNSPTAAKYDKDHPGGVPIRSAASGKSKILGLEKYGTQVTVTGPAVTGVSNFPGGTTGSDVWFPVLTSTGQTGYVSAYDFSGTPAPRPYSWPFGSI